MLPIVLTVDQRGDLWVLSELSGQAGYKLQNPGSLPYPCIRTGKPFYRHSYSREAYNSTWWTGENAISIDSLTFLPYKAFAEGNRMSYTIHEMDVVMLFYLEWCWAISQWSQRQAEYELLNLRYRQKNQLPIRLPESLLWYKGYFSRCHVIFWLFGIPMEITPVGEIDTAFDNN